MAHKDQTTHGAFAGPFSLWPLVKDWVDGGIMPLYHPEMTGSKSTKAL